MLEIRETEEFANWLEGSRDRVGKAKVLVRIQRLASGNPGDVKPVGDGISELRINYGPGYRIYYIRQGTAFIILLCGGDKGSQEKDIAKVRKLAAELEV